MSEGLRERKKAETRRALMSAALRLAEERGPDGVTVEAIAEAAGVSARTFFNYFPSKEDAVIGLAPAHTSELLVGLVEQPVDEPPLEALRGAVLGIAGRLEAGIEEWMRRRALFEGHPALAARHTAGFAEVERGMVEEIARRTRLDADRDTYPALVVAAALAVIRTVMAVWWERDRPGPIADFLDEAFDHLAEGLNSPLAVAPVGPSTR
jgi:AcrR family transcriptional regulator